MKLKCKYIIEFEMEGYDTICSLEQIKNFMPKELQKILEDELEVKATVTEVSAVIEDTDYNTD